MFNPQLFDRLVMCHPRDVDFDFACRFPYVSIGADVMLTSAAAERFAEFANLICEIEPAFSFSDAARVAAVEYLS